VHFTCGLKVFGTIPADIDVAQIYDSRSTVNVLSSRDYGFCAGEGRLRRENGWRSSHHDLSGGLSEYHPRLQTNTLTEGVWGTNQAQKKKNAELRLVTSSVPTGPVP